MVIDQIDVGCMAALDAEHNPPVRPHCDRPEALQVAFERMQPETRQIHVVRRSGTVQDEKDVPDLIQEVGADALPLTALEKPFQPLCLKFRITHECNL